jgi:hypothetical protein
MVGWNRETVPMANQRILVHTRYLKIILDSDNDNSQGYGVLQDMFPPYKKKE